MLKVTGLKKYFPIETGFVVKHTLNVKAVDGIDISIEKGKTHGLVGESGCGKTTAGRTILRLLEPTAGSVYYNGVDLSNLSDSAMRKLRPKLQIIFQDPYSSLNPRMRVQSAIAEPIRVHKLVKSSELKDKIAELLLTVGLQPDWGSRFPHQFSGGQRQRIGIARSLALNPDLIVCDEPVSALDVSIQAQILNLLRKIQDERGVSYLFIAHNLAVVRYICHTISVMYLGKIVETASTHQLFNNPMHPYTKALLDSNPIYNPSQRTDKQPLSGEIPSPVNPPAGCYFHPRCPNAMEICKTMYPEKTINDNHQVTCHLYST